MTLDIEFLCESFEEINAENDANRMQKNIEHVVEQKPDITVVHYR